MFEQEAEILLKSFKSEVEQVGMEYLESEVPITLGQVFYKPWIFRVLI